MAVTRIEIDTTGKDLVGANLADSNGVWGELDEGIKVWLGDICNPVLGTINGGSAYTDGTYTDVSLVRDTPGTTYGGRDMLCTITISGNEVTNVTITRKGNGFVTGDVLKFEDVTEVGGTGVDFSIPVTSADGTIGLIYDPDQRDETDEEQGWLFGVERASGDTGSYTYGNMFYKNDVDNDRFYDCNIRNWVPSSSNNGYGSMDKDSSYEYFWDESDGDGQRVSLTWCSDAGERFLCFSDDFNESPVGLFQMVRSAGSYPSLDIVSSWAGFEASSTTFNTRVTTSVTEGAAFVGNNGWNSTHNIIPADQNAIMTGHPCRTRSLYVGSVPPRLGTHKDSSRTWNQTIGVGSDEWRFLTSIFLIRESA